MSTILTVQLCGAPRLTWNGTEPVAITGGKPLALLIYLIATRQPHTRDVLANLLWSELSNQQARDNLRYALRDLRKPLGDYLVTSTHSIHFDDTQPYQLDSEFIRNVLSDPAVDLSTEALQTAVDQYQGEFLAGFSVRNAPVFEEWVVHQREELHRLLIHGLHSLAKRYLQQGDHTAGQRVTQKLLTLEPLDETGHRLYMQLLAAGGQRNAAINHYLQLRHQLSDELGIDPEPTTDALYVELLNGDHIDSDAERTLQPRGNLPVPLTPLVGRTAELAQLERHLQHTVYRCVSLVGPGGIGKTRLAIALGTQLQSDFPDGVWLIELSGLAPTTPAEPAPQLHDRLATAIAQTVGIPLYGAATPATQVANYLSRKTTLLILDSFEHLTTGAAWLPAVLADAPGLRLLVTTRHRPPLQSQLVYTLEGLDVPPATGVDGQSATHLLAQYAGLQLFVERAGSAGVPLSLDSATLATVGVFCRFVEGSPWAIELAVALLDRQSPAVILAAIGESYRALTSPLLDVPQRQRSAEAVFRTTWALLTPLEAQVLARCSVFRGGFTLAAAQTVAAATPTVINALVHKSLLRPNSADRYTMHDLVRQFAGEQLALDVGTAHQTHAAHAAYFTALLAGWQPAQTTEQHFRRAVTQDWANVEAAWVWASADGQVDLLQQGVAGLAEFCEMTGLWVEAERILDQTIARLRVPQSADPPPTPAPALTAAATQRLLAHLLWRRSYFLSAALGQTAEAQQLAEEALLHGRQLADATLLARGNSALAIVALYQGEYDRQAQLLGQALSLAAQTHDPYAEAFYRMLLGMAYKMQRDYGAAPQAFAHALRLAQSVGSSRLALRVLVNIGSFHWEAGNFSEAQTYLQQGLQYAQTIGQEDNAAFATACLGALALTLGDYANGRALLVEAEQRYEELGDAVLAAQMLNILATLSIEVGDMAAAANYTRRALASPAAMVYPVHLATLLNQGHLQRMAGEWSAARESYAAAYALSQQSNQLAEQLPIQAYLAVLDLAEGNVTAARTAVEPVLINFAATTFATEQRPQELLLITYQILTADGDPQSPSILQQAWALVQTQLAQITDPRLRQTFLTNVPVNRELAHLLAAGEGETANSETL